MRQFSFMENDDRRAFGAVRFVNAVDSTLISRPLQVVAAPPHDRFLPLRIFQNRRGLHVIQPGTNSQANPPDALAKYSGAFDPPPTKPDEETLTASLRVIDPAGIFLPTDFEMKLPRSLKGRDPLRSAAAAMVVKMYPSPATPIEPGWAVLRVMVWRTINVPGGGPNETVTLPLRGALVRALQYESNVAAADLTLLGTGVTEWRPRLDGQPATSAEALVALRDIAVTKWSGAIDARVFTDIQEIQLEVRFDPEFDPDAPEAIPNFMNLEGNAGVEAVLETKEDDGADKPAHFPIHAREHLVRRIVIDGQKKLRDFAAS